ncbi:6-phosphogluconolactonase [Indicator indicator]|uniref:6-phosphogluconolactonase n=1 Tax=Indicator indicator TaxID=1002788 RepID=UPI0023DF785D|nr:6-phosphogluconolactonase [Indicator indicator]
MAPAAAPRVSVFPSPQELGPALAQLVAEQAAAAAGGRFSLGLSGGSLVGLLSRDLPPAVAPTGPAAPAHWLVAFCDERLVPPQHPESTVGAYEAQLLPRLPGPGPRVLALTPGLAPAAAAEDYAAQLRQAFPGQEVPVFDLLLLGVGPDGHTCSLFPDHPLLRVEGIACEIGVEGAWMKFDLWGNASHAGIDASARSHVWGRKVNAED